MNILQALEAYTLAQKTVATNYIYLGIGLIIFSIAVWVIKLNTKEYSKNKFPI